MSATALSEAGDEAGVIVPNSSHDLAVQVDGGEGGDVVGLLDSEGDQQAQGPATSRRNGGGCHEATGPRRRYSLAASSGGRKFTSTSARAKCLMAPKGP